MTEVAYKTRYEPRKA